MLQLFGGCNMATGQSSVHWRAIRKAVAPAFAANKMRDACRVRWRLLHSSACAQAKA